MGELLSQSSCLCELGDVSASMGGVWQGSLLLSSLEDALA